MSLFNTTLFNLGHLENTNYKKTLKQVATALAKEGYDPVEQIVGYLLTGEPIYITSKHDARNQMRKLDRNKVLGSVVREYLK